MSATLAPAAYNREGVPDGCPLSVAEFEMMQGLAEGKNRAEIACDTGRALSTVRSILSTAYHRLGVHGASAAVARCYAEGWIGHDEPDINRLAHAVDRLATAVVTEEKSTLTGEQRKYLHAFEDYLYARSEDELHAARMRMNVTARYAHITPHPERGRHELMDVLVSLVRHGWA